MGNTTGVRWRQVAEAVAAVLIVGAIVGLISVRDSTRDLAFRASAEELKSRSIGRLVNKHLDDEVGHVISQLIRKDIENIITNQGQTTRAVTGLSNKLDQLLLELRLRTRPPASEFSPYEVPPR